MSGPTRTVVVTYLQMQAPPRETLPLPEGMLVLEAESPTAHFYRYLYAAVGRPYGWMSREHLSDAELCETITPPKGRALIAYWKGTPAGLAELNLTQRPDVQLQYFGLIPELVGSGLGKHFLAEVIRRVWTLKPRPSRFWLHTCTADSPFALPCYLRAGFVQFDQKTIQEPIPDYLMEEGT